MMDIRVLCVMGGVVLAGCVEDTTTSQRDAGPTPTDVVQEAVPTGCGATFLDADVGAAPRARAGGFTAGTPAWSFADAFDGCDNTLLVMAGGRSPLAQQIWDGDLSTLTQVLPQNTHVVFAHAGQDARQQAAALQSRLLAWIETLDADTAQHWFPRLHVSAGRLGTGDDWLADAWAAHPAGLIFVDRAQRVRTPGAIIAGNAVDLHALGRELVALNGEAERLAVLTAIDTLDVTLFDSHPHGGGWGAERNSFTTATFPQGDAFQAFNRMHITLELLCDAHDESKCPAWDRSTALYVCADDDAESCDTEIARWISPYRREGIWHHDITPFLAALGDGGGRRFRFLFNNAQPVSIRFHLSDDGSGVRPTSIVPLWRGGVFNEDYNTDRETIRVEAPRGSVKAEWVATVTGHGFGEDTLNCAEFCNHTHHVTVGDTEILREHPEAGTRSGCLDRVEDGVVPNQWGTWPYGRGGWCPGLEVRPWRAEITEPLAVPGGAEISYVGHVSGMPYVPRASGGEVPNSFGANILLYSYVVFWSDMP